MSVAKATSASLCAPGADCPEGEDEAAPGLVRVAADGVAIEVEVYALAAASFGTFVRQVPRPLAIGKVSLADGSRVPGFVCEPAALVGATDISEWGGWRAWRRR